MDYQESAPTLDEQMPPVLCNLVKKLGFETVLQTVDWKDAGVSKEVFTDWWNEHVRKDALKETPSKSHIPRGTLKSTVLAGAKLGQQVYIITGDPAVAVMFRQILVGTNVKVRLYSKIGNVSEYWDDLQQTDAYAQCLVFVDENMKYLDHFHLFRKAMHFNPAEEI